MSTAKSTKWLFTTGEAAKLLGVSPRTMEGWRARDEGPRFVRVGPRAVRYKISDLEEYLHLHLRKRGKR